MSLIGTRISRAGTVVALSTVVAVSVPVSVASGKTKGAKGTASTTLKCSLAIAAQPPAGSATVDQPPQQGNQYGPVHCSTTGFGGGVAADSFTVDGAGDTVGHYTEYLSTGTLSGAFDLTPTEGQSGNFAATAWTGTITLTRGTGAYKGTTGRKGTLSCTSSDSVHLACTERITVSRKG